MLSGVWVASSSLGGVRISEFMANNDTTWATAAGLYEDWIEIHNGTGAAIDLAGWYVTDDPSDLRKWQIPSIASTSTLADDGYLLVVADGASEAVIGEELHASFKLASGGEFLALVEPDGETVADQYAPRFPPQTADVSYGLDAATGLPAYFSVPTPGAANAQAIADAVKFSRASGTFTSAFHLVLSVPSPAASIRYTLDGSVPGPSSTLYQDGSPVSIQATVRVRARSFEPGLADGPVRSETFLHLASDAASFASEIPLVVIDTFGQGEIPDPASPVRQGCRLMVFEPADGVSRLSTPPSVSSRAGVRRRGESTLRPTASKPSLSVETWGEVDEEARSIEPLGMPAESDWILYAPWTIDTAMMRDVFMYEVSNQAGRYAVRTRFVEVFLNVEGGSISRTGDYVGLYVLMERIKRGGDRVDVAGLPAGVDDEPGISGGYIWKLDKLDPDDRTFDAAGKTFAAVYPKDLPAAQSTWLAGAIDAIDAAIPDGDYASGIDVASFADHHILNVFAQNADGLRVSTFYHKDRGGRVRMGPIWDFDRSMGSNDERVGNPEVWSLATDTNYFFHNGGPLWFRALALNDPEFWVVWTDRWRSMREGPLSEAAIIERIERYRAEIGRAALRNDARWPGLLGGSEWDGAVDRMKQHVLTRAQWIDDQLIDPPVFNHPGGRVPYGFALVISGAQTPYYTLDGSDPRAGGGSAAGSAYGAAIPILSNTLVKCRSWDGSLFGQAPRDWPWSALTEAVFVVDPAPLAVTEIMYHPRGPDGPAEAGYTASDFEFLEIQNIGETACSLVGVRFLDGIDFDFTYGSPGALEPGAYGVVVRNLDAFRARYAEWAGLSILGVYTGRLNDGGEKLALGYASADMAPLAAFTYEDDWYPATDGEGFSLVRIDPRGDPFDGDSKQAWRPSSEPDGSPGRPNPPAAHPQGAVVINEVLSHQDNPDPGDWIELHNTTGGEIDIGGWFLSDSRGDLKKYPVPGGTVIPANGFVVFTESAHFGSAFALSEHGDAVYLSAGADGDLSIPAYREYQDFGGQDRGATFGRHLRSTGAPGFPTMQFPTPGAANAGPRVGPLVFAEIMYHPPHNGQEYVVIENPSGGTVRLYDPAHPSHTWAVSGIDFVFPPGVELAGGDSLVLVREPIQASQFRTWYNVPASIEIFTYPGALDNDGETLALKKPGVPETATGYVPSITVEQVTYGDRAPWPPEADGGGRALHRVNAEQYADDPAHWRIGDASFGPTLARLTVIQGSGGGEYAGGTSVPVQADDAPAGHVFVEWIGHLAGVADARAPATTLTMPGRDTTITARYAPDPLLLGEHAIWKYHDQGQDLGSAWREPGYDDAAWPSGPAQLGYGDGDEVTVVDYGGDGDNKHITTYFRSTFIAPDPSSLASLSLRLLSVRLMGTTGISYQLGQRNFLHGGGWLNL